MEDPPWRWHGKSTQHFDHSQIVWSGSISKVRVDEERDRRTLAAGHMNEPYGIVALDMAMCQPIGIIGMENGRLHRLRLRHVTLARQLTA